jgi:hypothetical protein
MSKTSAKQLASTDALALVLVRRICCLTLATLGRPLM